MQPNPGDAVLGGRLQPRAYDAVLSGRVKALQQSTKNAGNALDKYLSRQGKYIRTTAKTAARAKEAIDKAKKVTDALNKGNWKDVGAKFGRFMSLGLVALTLFSTILGFANTWAINSLSEINIREFERVGREFSVQFRAIQIVNSRVAAVNQQVKKLKADLDATKKTVYADVQNLLNNFPKVRKTANDALYEVRAGRVKLEAQIANAAKKSNDALYEVRQGRAKTEAQLALIKKQANDALYETRQGRVKIDAMINDFNSKLTRLNNEVPTITRRLTTVEQRINIRPPSTNQPGNNQQNNNDVITRANFPTLIRQNAQTISTVVEPYTAKFVDGKLQSFENKFDGKINKKLDGDKLVTEIQLKTGQIVRVLEPAIKEITKPIVEGQIKPINQLVDAHGNAIGNILKLFDGHNKRIDKAEYRIDKEGIDNDKQMIDIEGLKQSNKELIQKYKEQEKVNAEGNKKLDELLKWSLGISPVLALIPARTRDLIRPDIPTRPQITQIVKDNTPQSSCRFSEAPIYDAAGRVNAHTTALDVIQTGLITNVNNTANTINTKLGEQLTGGIAGKLVNGFKWLQLDRALSVLTFAATVQNHLMLSREIGTTLLGAFSNVLSLIGLKDDSGQAFDLGSIINSSIENLIKGIVGAENYVILSETWAKANRIYQATTNVLNSFQSLTSTILTGMELIGSYTGKIGNALKKSGEVLETAYGWMNPQPKFNRISQTLENLQQGASTIQQVTQAPLDVINAVTELQNANTELIKAIKEDDKPENKAAEIPEPEKLKADELASKIASRISNILPDDLFNAAD